MPAIFLSYRRDDSREATSRMFAWLLEHGIPEEEIYVDRNPKTNQYGTDFPKNIADAIHQAYVMLVIIGPAWPSARRRSWSRVPRIMEPEDWVRKEIALALDSKLPIVPVLLNDTSMPEERQLPAELRGLYRINAAHVHATNPSRFDTDMLGLAAGLSAFTTSTLSFDGERFLYLLGTRKQYLTELTKRYHDISLPVTMARKLPLQYVYQPLRLKSNPEIAASQKPENRLKLMDESHDDPMDHQSTTDFARRSDDTHRRFQVNQLTASTTR